VKRILQAGAHATVLREPGSGAIVLGHPNLLRMIRLLHLELPRETLPTVSKPTT
jgi:hypothetical protein